MSTEIVGKFKAKKIRIGIEYEIRLMIMFDTDASGLEGVVEIELKLPGGSKLQRTEILENQLREIWTEICIGKFMMKEPQQISEEFGIFSAPTSDHVLVECGSENSYSIKKYNRVKLYN